MTADNPSRVSGAAQQVETRDTPTPEETQDMDFDALLRSARRWSELHMDQWDKIKFNTEFGTVYLSLLRQVPDPDDFFEVSVP